MSAVASVWVWVWVWVWAGKAQQLRQRWPDMGITEQQAALKTVLAEATVLLGISGARSLDPKWVVLQWRDAA